jgi:hypothetical protein
MTPAFVALHWSSPAGRRRANALCPALSPVLGLKFDLRDDLRIVVKPGSLVRCSNNLWILGTIAGDPTAAGHALNMSATAAAELLVHDCWGEYVAIFDEIDGLKAMADPSGAGRAHLLVDRDLAMLTDALTPSLARLGGFAVHVNDALLAGGLVEPPTLVAAPLLRKMRSLNPGVLTTISSDGHDTVICGRRYCRPDGSTASGSGLGRLRLVGRPLVHGATRTGGRLHSRRRGRRR